jgi:hypothetical protein
MKHAIWTLALAAAVVVGCGDEKKADGDPITETPAKETTATSVEIQAPWMRPSAANQNTACYFLLVNGGDEADTLLAASSELAKRTEVHETYMDGDLMGMREVEEIVAPPGETIEFEPGGKHIMLIGTLRDIELGATETITLTFARAGDVVVEAPVKKPETTNVHMQHMDH